MIHKGISTGMSALSLAVAVVLTGCSSGGGGGSASSGNTVSGVITGFGSVYVNGVEYNTDNAHYSVDGEPGSSDYDLDVGMRVTLQGSVNPDGVTGTASAITYTDELEGVVLEVGAADADGTRTLNIMGQSVTMNSLTVFDSDVPGIASEDAIVPGNVVEVSGHSDGMGNITASRIEVKAADLAGYSGELELKGLIAATNTDLMTFQIGALIVDYSGALLDNLPSDPGSWDGIYVEVKSDSAPVANGGSYTLAATIVELEDDGIMGINGSGGEVELQGMIVAVYSADSFSLDGQMVTIVPGDDNPEEGKITAVEPSMVGRMVEAEGYIDGNGTLIAHEVGLEDDIYAAMTTYRDYVQSVDTGAGMVTLQGGQAIIVTNHTIMQDSLSSGADHYFNLADLRSGDYLEVHAYTNGNGDQVAAKLEREDAPL